MKKFSLVTLAKMQITLRIFICIILLFLSLLIITWYNISNQIKKQEIKIEQECQLLESFVVSQYLIENYRAAKERLVIFNKNHLIHVEWIDTDSVLPKKFSWIFPFSWKYQYPLQQIRANLGFFEVSGSFLNDKDLMYEFIERLVFLILFSVLIFLLLRPLATKIPNKLFIEPINNILKLLDRYDQDTPEKKIILSEANEIRAIEEKILKIIKDKQDRTRQDTLVEISARVAHDIRSPIAAMEMSLHILAQDISKEKIVMIKTAIQSVRDIANNLLDRYRHQTSEVSHNKERVLLNDDSNLSRPILLSSLIDSAISQKRQEWQHGHCELDFVIEEGSKSSWLTLAPNELKRILSNLLNNAYEALENEGKIHLSLHKTNECLQLEISDNGLGIPVDKITSALNGISTKHPGEGLGLSFAKKYMEQLGGSLELFSEHKKGTKVVLKFPHENNPAWFPQEIILKDYHTVMVLDDDSSMQSLWHHRLQNYSISIKQFMNYAEAVEWYRQHQSLQEKIIFLVDYELTDHGKNGLSFLEPILAKKNAYLVTSHAEEINIQQAVLNAGVWLIPKILAGDIPIKS